MDPVLALLFGVVAPGVVALVIALVLGGWQRDADNRFSGAAAVALAAGYVLAWQLILGLPELVPVDVTQASPWFALIGALLAWPLSKVPVFGRVAASVVLGAGLAAWLTSPFVPHVVATDEVVLYGAAIAATFVIFDVVLAAALRTIEPRGGAVAVVTLVTGASLAVLFGNIASLAQLVGALAAGLGALIVLGFWRRSAANLSHATLVIAAIVTTNLWSGKLAGDTSLLAIGVLAAMPLLLWAAARWLAKPRKTVVALALPAAVVLVPVAAVIALAGLRYFDQEKAAATSDTPAATGDDGYDPGYGY